MSNKTRNRPFWTDLSNFEEELSFKIAVLSLCRMKGTNEDSIRIKNLREEINLYIETYNFYYRINMLFLEEEKHKLNELLHREENSYNKCY